MAVPRPVTGTLGCKNNNVDFTPGNYKNDKISRAAYVRLPLFVIVLAIVMIFMSFACFTVTTRMTPTFIGLALSLLVLGGGGVAVLRPVKCHGCGRRMDKVARNLDPALDEHIEILSDGERTYVRQYEGARASIPCLAAATRLCYVCHECQVYFDSLHSRYRTVARGHREVMEFENGLTQLGKSREA